MRYVRRVNTTGDAISGGNETNVYGGDIVAMNTGAASANGGAATGGTIDAGGGTATGGAATVNNTSNLVPRPRRGHHDLVELAEVVVGLLDQRQLQPQEDRPRLLLVER